MRRCLICFEVIHAPLTINNFYKKPDVICEKCLTQIKQFESVKRCARCLKKLGPNEAVCLDCKWLEQRFRLVDQVVTVADYQGLMKSTIVQYKFHLDIALSHVFVEIMPQLGRYDYLVPIPSPHEKKLMRRFDHIGEILKAKQIPFHPILEAKVRAKQSNLTKRERAKSDNPFLLVDRGYDLENKEILLIDDIYTTGLTVHHAAELLFFRKVRKIRVLTFARS